MPALSPPRKKKRVLLEVPAIVKWKAEARPLASEPKASRPELVRGMKAGNDNRPVEQPAAIVTAKKPRGPDPAPSLAQLRRRAPANRHGSSGRAVPGIPAVA